MSPLLVIYGWGGAAVLSVLTGQKQSVKGTLDWDFFGFDFEICIFSLLVTSMWKY